MEVFIKQLFWRKVFSITEERKVVTTAIKVK